MDVVLGQRHRRNDISSKIGSRIAQGHRQEKYDCVFSAAGPLGNLVIFIYDKHEFCFVFLPRIIFGGRYFLSYSFVGDRVENGCQSLFTTHPIPNLKNRKNRCFFF